jgi:Tfp pilus assembly protein PilN
MNHPFNDFLTQKWHDQKRDRRIFRYGLVLVGLVVITTFSAFATTMTHWRSVFQNQQAVSAKWDDAQQRVQGFLNSERSLRSRLEKAKAISTLLDVVPKSILLSELTSVLPEQAFVNTIRIDTRKRVNDEGISMPFDKVHVSGESTDDATVSLFVESLMKSSCFENVSLQYSKQKQGGIARDFAISMEVQSVAVHVEMLAEVNP